MKLGYLQYLVQTDTRQNIYFIFVADLPMDIQLPLLRGCESTTEDLIELFEGFMYRNVDKNRRYLVKSLFTQFHIITQTGDYTVVLNKKLEADDTLAVGVDLRED